MEHFFLSLEDLEVTLGGTKVLEKICLQMKAGEQWALTGPSASGKTVLARTLSGQHFYSGKIRASFGESETLFRQVALVEQQHRFSNLENRNDFYYQQRYNSFDAEMTRTAGQDLESFCNATDIQPGDPRVSRLSGLLQISHLSDEPLIQLSNGENKRLQLAKALLLNRALLILDQPFTGLDKKGRLVLDSVLSRLSSEGFTMLLIVTPHEIPEYITHVALIENGCIRKAVSRDIFLRGLASKAASVPAPDERELRSLSPDKSIDFEYAVILNQVNVRYGEKWILRDLTWRVRHGEKWSVSGPNGAGKSTLLSLLTGDHPQAYANEIYLFDRRRGTGESIWDIKKRTGYVSPELHLYFESSATAFQAVASGLFDTIGLFRRLSEEQEELVLRWMSLLALEGSRNKLLSQLSLGEQRLVLLARALVKNPSLLILDEPCQGLDEEHTEFFRQLVDRYCRINRVSLIYVSHYEEEIPSCVDHFLRLEKGMAV